MKFKKLILSIGMFFYKKESHAMTLISKQEYLGLFSDNLTNEQKAEAYRQAWQAKNFEIDNYWKRTNYFWAFQVASFAGYFSVISSKSYELNPQILYCITCIGLVTSFAWTFINQGSKTWQRHWENHVDMLEDQITGPLYKIVTETKTFSVSKINDIVSRFIVFIWILLAFKYINDHLVILTTDIKHIDYMIWCSSLGTVYFIGSMYFGYGRGRFGTRNVKFFQRDK